MADKKSAPARARSSEVQALGNALQPQCSIDPSQATRFLQTLDPGAQSWTFQTFDDNKARGSKQLAHVFHGSFDQHAAALEKLNRQGAGIFVTINETDGKGRKRENIQRVRAVFSDFDGTPPPAKLPRPPHLVVQSSSGRWHVYWRVDGLPLDQFAPVQTALAKGLGSDPSVCDLSRVMRLPGFLHQKGEPWLVQLHPADATARAPYPSELFRLPTTAAATPSTLSQGRFVPPETVTDLRSALNALRADDYEQWIAVGQALHELGDVGRGLWMTWSQTSEKWRPQDARRWDSFNGDRTGYEAVFKRAQTAGWVNPRSNAAAARSEDDASLVGICAERWLVPTSELRTRQKPVAWHIKRWLQADALIMVHGPSGAGKTFLVIDWCMRIATGMSDWFGNRVKPGFVVYLAGEGYRGLGSRLQAWAVHHGTAGQAENMVMSRSGCDLDSPDGLARVIDAIRSSGIKPCLIVVDTLHRFMRGDENTAKDAGAMIANCDTLKRDFGCTVLLVHHTGVSADAQHRARGSSAWKAALDVEIGVQPPPTGESAIMVSLLKMRDADPVPPICVKLQRIDLPGWVDEDGEQVSSAVLVEGGAPPRGRPATPVEEKKQQWRSAWLAHGSILPRGDHQAPYLSRASLKEWLEKNTELTQVTIASYLKPSTKSGAIGMLLGQGWLGAHGDGWECLDAADSSTMLMMRNAVAGRAKVGAP